MQLGEDVLNFAGVTPVFQIERGIVNVEGDASFSLA